MAADEVNRAIVSRKEARALGLKRYFTGKPCPHGHTAERFTSKSTCCECVKKFSAERYERKPPRISQRDEAAKQGLIYYYGRKCAHGHDGLRFVKGCHCVQCVRIWHRKRAEKPEVKEQRRAAERKRYAKDPEKHINKVKRQYKKHGEKIRAKRRADHNEKQKDPEYRKAAQERVRQWALDNPERARSNAKISRHRRRALELLAPGSFTADDIADILRAQKRKCAYCRCKLGLDYHVDHIVPLSKGGTNDRSNIQVACPKCNLEKGTRDPIDHARSLGMLL